ncbi:hypothetical protein PALB_20490 [Pseudoalteromonas luteoviolacea B = ATCC 29581]|nr:hypothetical protein PALB_20490 [Pseudoalteromonas luteoviolacea B = ATCC 29581]
MQDPEPLILIRLRQQEEGMINSFEPFKRKMDKMSRSKKGEVL